MKSQNQFNKSLKEFNKHWSMSRAQETLIKAKSLKKSKNLKLSQ